MKKKDGPACTGVRRKSTPKNQYARPADPKTNSNTHPQTRSNTNHQTKSNSNPQTKSNQIRSGRRARSGWSWSTSPSTASGEDQLTNPYYKCFLWYSLCRSHPRPGTNHARTSQLLLRARCDWSWFAPPSTALGEDQLTNPYYDCFFLLLIMPVASAPWYKSCQD